MGTRRTAKSNVRTAVYATQIAEGHETHQEKPRDWICLKYHVRTAGNRRVTEQSTDRELAADGLRGWACIIVAVFHFFCAFLPQLEHHIDPQTFPAHLNPSIVFTMLTTFPLTLFHNGPLAVFVFFTLSGMVLSKPYYTTSNWDAIIRRRIQRRYLRLTLPIMCTIFFTYVLSWLGFFFNQQAALKSGSTAWLSVQHLDNILVSDAFTVATYRALLFGDTTLNTSFWTLGIEFRWSIFLMALLLVAPRKNHRAFLLIIMVGVTLSEGANAIYPLAMLSGLMLHQFTLTLRKAYVCLATGLTIGSYQLSSGLFLVGASWHEIATTYGLEPRQFQAIGAIAIVAGIKNGAFHTVLTHRLSSLLGHASYPIYLWHFVLISSLFSYLYYYYVFSVTFFILLSFFYMCCISALILLVNMLSVSTLTSRVTYFVTRWSL